VTAHELIPLPDARNADTAAEEADGGPELDAADRAAERRLAERAGLVPAHRTPIDGKVITHRAVSEGSAPEHADNRTVRAALADAAGIVKARISDNFALDTDSDDAESVHGMVVAPRTGYEGHAQVWFLDRGKPEWARKSVDLRSIAKKLRAAGWIVYRGSRALNIQASELVWRADNARHTAGDIYPSAHAFQPVTGNDGSTVHGWTFATHQAGISRYGWADGRRGMSGPQWDTRQQAEQDLTSVKQLTSAEPVPIAPETGARKFQGPTTAQIWQLAELLVGERVTLPLQELAIIADARATCQDDKGGKSAASQYRQCAHHLRQADETLARADDDTDEERAATADMAGAYVEAAATHAREADLTAI
jgi:hypothetical protein